MYVLHIFGISYIAMRTEVEEAFEMIRAYWLEKAELAEIMLTDNAANPDEEMDIKLSLIREQLAVRDKYHELIDVLDKIALKSDEMEYEICATEGTDASVRQGLRSFKIEITKGMINQKMLTLTAPKRKGLVKIGEVFHIVLPDGEEFKTELVEPGNRLKERGAFGRLYQKNEVEPYDTVIMQEVEKGKWKISLILQKVILKQLLSNSK